MGLPEHDILIRNALVVNYNATFQTDILIGNGRIRRLAKGLTEKTQHIFDAKGMVVFPGGIDPHVHLNLPTFAGYSSDDFESGSRAALAGGTTTIIDFVTPVRGESLTDALDKRMKEAKHSFIDYSFHISPVAWSSSVAEEINQCIAMGFPSFKVYMAYKDSIGLDEASIETVMFAVARGGGMVVVHCEEGDEINNLREQMIKTGHSSPAAHALSRPPHTESKAVEKAIKMADKTACRLYIVHVSTAESTRLISQARNHGQQVWGEVCPQHLLLDVSCYEKDFENAAACVMSPPLRSKTHRKALWEALANGSLHTVGTDHCPFNLSQKAPGKDDFRKIANGAGGIEHRLSLLHTFGVMAGRIDMQSFVHLVSASPAKIFGLYPAKGLIAEGSDADLVIWDTQAKDCISAASHHQRCDINIFEGINTTGKPVTVIAGGRIAFHEGKFTSGLKGRLLRRPALERTH